MSVWVEMVGPERFRWVQVVLMNDGRPAKRAAWRTYQPPYGHCVADNAVEFDGSSETIQSIWRKACEIETSWRQHADAFCRLAEKVNAVLDAIGEAQGSLLSDERRLEVATRVFRDGREAPSLDASQASVVGQEAS